MARVQLAINVADLEASVAFYETLFATPVHKRRPGYANFEIEDPPLKLVLMEQPADMRGSGVVGALNHLGVEVETVEQVTVESRRLGEAGLTPFEQEQTNCCHAVQDKAWVSDPAGVPWEVYTVTDDNPAEDCATETPGCCMPSEMGKDSGERVTLELAPAALQTTDSACACGSGNC